MEKELEVRKGPWSEEEDVQLFFHVKLFGDRRWDFIAKVSGLKGGGRHMIIYRSGKSCRLRWVNYLHPGLKRDKMTPHEERLIVHLQSKWGNRWSKIAQKLPGRTDNEIKNYWRTHMRKEAQERKKKEGSSSSSASSLSSSSSAGMHSLTADVANATTDEKRKSGFESEVEEGSKVYSMDEIWKEFEFSDGFTSKMVASPIWDDYCNTDSLWCMNIEEESKILMQQQPIGDHHFQSFHFCNYMIG